jgi:hypothetical protein
MAKSYFSHDSNAKDDPKIIKLIDSLGLEGYGAFWVLIESLREQPNLRLPIISIPRLSRTFGITQQKLEGVIYHFELFQHDDEFFYSDSLINRMGEMCNKFSERTLRGHETRRQRIDNQQNLVAEAMQKVAKVANESKVNESKVNEREIHPHEIGKSIEFIKIMTGKDLNQNEVLNYWKAFILNTNKTYPNENEKVSHFRNWMKTQIYNNRQPAEPSQVLIKLK